MNSTLNWVDSHHVIPMACFRYRHFILLNTIIKITTIPIASIAWTADVINRSMRLWKIDICNGATTTIKNNETAIIINHIKKITPNNPKSFITRSPFHENVKFINLFSQCSKGNLLYSGLTPTHVFVILAEGIVWFCACHIGNKKCL